MESIQQFELILSETEFPLSKNVSTEYITFDETFADDLFINSPDEFTGIDFLAELEKDSSEKMHFEEELQQITENIDLPLYDLVTGGSEVQGVYDNKLSRTEQLLEEFDSIYDAVEHNLTPPQTPPEQKYLLSQSEESPHFVQNIPTIDQQQFIYDYQQPQQQPSPQHGQFMYVDDSVSPLKQEITYVFENSNHSIEDDSSIDMIVDPEIISSPADIQRELEVVDEIIQAHSRSQSDYDDDNCTVLTTSSWSPRSEFSSASSVCSQDYEPVKKSSLRGVTKKRSPRPYGRNPDEKKSRKKEQNKNAATRYRQKKKEEVGVILSEEATLMEKNKKLTMSYKDTKREVKYLKSLLRELFQARGFM